VLETGSDGIRGSVDCWIEPVLDELDADKTLYDGSVNGPSSGADAPAVAPDELAGGEGPYDRSRWSAGALPLFLDELAGWKGL
jgi:hypothetical protein